MSTVHGSQFIDDLLAPEPIPVNGHPTGDEIHFTMKKFVLHALLEKAANVVPTRDVMPVLKCFQFEVEDTRLRVIATDLELSVVATTEMVTIHNGGVAVFPARKMLEIVRQADDGIADIHVKGATAAITIGRTTWNLKLQGGADYPPMPQFSEGVFTTVDRLAFGTALHCVRYAACKDANRGSLMMIDVRGGKMTACDGARFQQATVPTFPFDFRIPIGAVDDLLKLLRATDLPEISIGQSDNHLIFVVGPDVFCANKLLAQFPDMEALLLRPALENKHRLVVDRDELLSAIKRVRINADTETSAIGLHLAPGYLSVVARDKFNNDASETIQADWPGTERTLVVNHAFLTEMVITTDTRSLSFWLGDDTKTRKAPVMLREENIGTVGVVQQMLSDWVST
jgi:DNA polymerase-3 subunit beta